MGYIEHAYIYIQCTCSVVVFSFAIPLSSLSTVFFFLCYDYRVRVTQVAETRN